MKVNVSAVKTFLYDQSDWYFAYVLKRVPRVTSPALQMGTLWHGLLEEFAKTGVLLDMEYQEQAEHMLNLFDAYRERYEFDETLLIEAPLETVLLGGPHILVGRPDRVVRYQGKLWHVQNRTLSDRTVMSVYLAAAERDLHELAYAHLITRHFKLHLDQYGGTLMNICRKVSKKKLAEDPQSAFIQEFIPISASQVAEAIDDIVQVADDMVAIMEHRRRAVQNRDTDKGRFGNRLSSYFAVRIGSGNLSDEHLFQPSESRYDTEAVAE